MESPLSQESINISVEDSRCLAEVSDRARPGHLGQFRSARLGLTTYDLQLWKVITPSSELRFGCLDSMESPFSQESIYIPVEDSRCQTEVSD